MASAFPFEPMLALAWMSVMLLIGVALRAKLPFIQRFLIPSSLIGGLIGMVLVNTRVLPLEPSLLETIAYHFFNISFISLGLGFAKTERKTKDAPVQKEVLKGSLWMGLIEGVIFPIQAIIGGGLILMFTALDYALFPTFGFLAPLGFIEGPGQALSIGKVWEGGGFDHAATIGLTFATIGFMFAFFVGVPLANWAIRRGLTAQAPTKLPAEILRGILDRDKPKENAGELMTYSGNIDTLAFQIAAIGGVFLLTFGLVSLLSTVVGGNIGEMLWGFFFFFGLAVALIVKFIIIKVKLDHLIDSGLQRRVTGWSVDFLVVATVMAIQLVIVFKVIAAIAIISILCGFVSTLVVFYLGKRIGAFNIERSLAIYGTVTGTASSGLLLLRIVDPEFKTPVAMEVGFMLLFAAPWVLSGMLLLAAPIEWGWSVELTMLVFAAMLGICLFLLRIFKLWGKPKY